MYKILYLFKTSQKCGVFYCMVLMFEGLLGILLPWSDCVQAECHNLIKKCVLFTVCYSCLRAYLQSISTSIPSTSKTGILNFSYTCLRSVYALSTNIAFSPSI